VTGDTDLDPPPRCALITGPFIWYKLELAAGLAGTVADQGKRVWATNDGAYTCIDPGGSGAEVGYVDYYIDATYADVVMRNIGGYVDSLSPLPTPTPTPTPT